MPKIHGEADRTHAFLVYDSTIDVITIKKLLWDYRCAVCDGKLEAVAIIDNDIVMAHKITCHTCGQAASEVKHVESIRQETIDTQIIFDGLPETLRAMIQKPTGNAEAAAAALYKKE